MLVCFLWWLVAQECLTERQDRLVGFSGRTIGHLESGDDKDPAIRAPRTKEAALGGDLHGLYCRKRLYGSERHAAFYTAGVTMHPCP